MNLVDYNLDVHSTVDSCRNISCTGSDSTLDFSAISFLSWCPQDFFGFSPLRREASGPYPSVEAK